MNIASEQATAAEQLHIAVANSWGAVRGADNLNRTGKQVAEVVVISPSALLRCGLRYILKSCDEAKLVAEAADPREGACLIADLRPDVLVLDMTRETDRPVKLNYINELIRRHRHTRILALLTARGYGELAQLLTVGVAGIVSRDSEPATVMAGIAALAAGRGFYNIERHTDIDVHQSHKRQAKNGLLTKREFEVLQLLAVGMTNKQMSAKLHISETTAKFHVSGLMRKFGVNRRAEIVYQATQQGLV